MAPPGAQRMRATQVSPHEREWLTVVEVAKLLGVSEKTIRRGVASGSIPHWRPAGARGSIRIPRSAIGSGLSFENAPVEPGGRVVDSRG